jgi:DNA-directed RNA polymerase subunit RPC12/RpoP
VTSFSQVDRERVNSYSTGGDVEVKCKCGSKLLIPVNSGIEDEYECENCGGEFYLTVEVWEKDR